MKQLVRKNLVLPLSMTALLLAGCGGRAISTSSSTPPTAADPSPTPGVPANAVTISDIQKLGNWQNCTSSCTGTAFAQYAMKEGVSSPSLSGSSAQFTLQPGTQPFGGALWFKFLTIDAAATHFSYDLYFYTDNPSAPQALEFNASQSTGGNRYSFSTQCDLSNQRAWLIWSPPKNGWVSTGVPCVQPPPNTWNHLVWEFERNSSDQVVFDAVTLNGDRHQIGIAMPSTRDSSNGIDVAFQLDANRTATPYSVWLDKINLSYW